MKKTLLSVLLFVGLWFPVVSWGQSFGEVSTQRLYVYENATIEDLTIDDDLTVTGNIAGSSTVSFTTSATVTGAEAGDASVIIDADEGDDNVDTWTIRSTASDNDLDVLNHTSVVLTVGSTGAITATGAITGTEMTLSGVAGSGKAVCVKADGALGVCSDAVGGGGTCTCS